MIYLFAYFQFKANHMTIERQGDYFVYTLVGNVWIRTEKYEITSGKGIYYESDSLAELFENVFVRGPGYILKSDYLKYRTDGSYLLVKGGVYLEDSLRIIEAGWIEVIDDVARARDSVYVFLKNRNVAVWGDSALYNINSGRGKVWGRIRIEILRDTDTVHIDTRFLEFGPRNLRAIPLIRLVSSREEARGDTLDYVLNRDSTESAIIRGSGYVKWSDGVGYADTVNILYRNNVLLKAVFSGNARITQRDSSRTIHIEADLVRVEFGRGDVSRVWSEGIGKAYIREENPPAGEGKEEDQSR